MTRQQKINLLQSIAKGVKSVDELKPTSAVVIYHPGNLFSIHGKMMNEAEKDHYIQNLETVFYLPHNGRN